ncbi:MAG: hypothetical protein M3680_30300, partial [Myxococcota bacterium]|nr:hypothetical protein [Myxococcota bacterium]
DVLALLTSASAMTGGDASTAAPPRAGARPTLPPLPATPTLGSSETTLAVLPVTCAAGDEYLADGVHEDLIDILSTTPTLRVRAAGILRAGTEHDPRALGQQLGVDHVVVASLRRTPDALRVSARLISVADGFQIWTHRVQCTSGDLLATSEALAREIATALSTRANAATRPTDPRSVDLYLRARAEMRRFWGSHAQSAADLFDQAYALSPGSTPIAGARAFATVQAWVFQGEPSLVPRVQAALEEGLASGHPEAVLASAAYRFNTGDPIGGATALGSALVRAPMLAQGHEMTAKILVEISGGEARKAYETAIALDPARSAILEMELARLDALEGWWERADRRVLQVLEDPDRSIAQLAAVVQARLAGWRHDREGMFAAAHKFSGRAGAPANFLLQFLSAIAQTRVVDEQVWRQFITGYGGPGRPQRGQLMGLQLLSEMALVLGYDATAIQTLEQADAINFIDITALDRCPLYDRIATEPRFIAVRERTATRAATVLAALRAAAG